MAMTNRTLLVALSVLSLLSALAVIYSKYQARRVFNDIQLMERELDRYEVEWGRLQLELTMLTEENRVEVEARKRLKLTMPEREKTIYIKP